VAVTGKLVYIQNMQNMHRENLQNTNNSTDNTKKNLTYNLNKLVCGKMKTNFMLIRLVVSGQGLTVHDRQTDSQRDTVIT